ncbi:MutS protein msh5 [Rhizophlyctis rosea]|uniref:MutS protein msh5 n=1 Tax=Rhizophlyctis rosea TaxID=64517 RepID=A0AAD5SL24_9FUNG|nr:MutS protein msh5 [Rhizophlyctis rosea]
MVSQANSVVAESLSSSETEGPTSHLPQLALQFHHSGELNNSFPSSGSQFAEPTSAHGFDAAAHDETLLEDFATENWTQPELGVDDSELLALDMDETPFRNSEESPVFQLGIDSHPLAQRTSSSSVQSQPLNPLQDVVAESQIGADILSDTASNLQTQQFTGSARARLFWAVTTGMRDDEIEQHEAEQSAMDLDLPAADSSREVENDTGLRTPSHSVERSKVSIGEDDDLFPEDSISVVALRMSQQMNPIQTTHQQSEHTDAPNQNTKMRNAPPTANVEARRFDQHHDDGGVLESDNHDARSSSQVSADAPLPSQTQSTALSGIVPVPRVSQPLFGHDALEYMEEDQPVPSNFRQQKAVDDDWVTVDTRVSAHSMQSLSKRAFSRKSQMSNGNITERTNPMEQLHAPGSDSASKTSGSANVRSADSTRASSNRSHISSSDTSSNGANLEPGGPPMPFPTNFRGAQPAWRESATTASPSRKRPRRQIHEETESELGLPSQHWERPQAADSSRDSRADSADLFGSEAAGPSNRAANLKRVRFNEQSSAATSEHLPWRDDDEPDKIVMACSYKNGKIGAAFYSVRDSKLYLMEDMEENQQFDLLKLLKFQVGPSVIVTNGRADEAFLDILNSEAESMPPDFNVEIRPSTDFLYAAAKNRLLSIRLAEKRQRDLPSVGAGLSNPQHERMDMCLYLEGIVSLDCKEMVGCAGALLTYISKARLMGEIRQSGHEMEIHSVEQFNLNLYMQVNADTLCSLQVFIDEAHPNMHSKSSKEGLSLFGILDMTKTPSGKALLKQWFLRPVLDLDILEERHRTVAFFLRPDMLFVAEQLGNCLKHVKNIPRILHSMKLTMSIADWQALLKFAYYTLKMRSAIRDVGNADIHILEKIKETFNAQHLKDVGSYINNVVDFDQSANEGRFVVKPQIDEELDELKRTYHGLDDLLSVVAKEVSKSIPQEFSRSLNVIYFPQLGYLITIPLKQNMTKEEDFLVDGLYFQFCTANTVYYKSDQMFELDETVGDIHSMIVDREIEIMQRLQETVLEYSESLQQTAQVCAEIDCLLSLAEAAKKYNYRRPRMTNENVLHIVKGRHPLQELCVDVFIGNETALGGNDDEPRAMLLTGANFSGKSIYLKQVALITYMAHIGSFVPAESATIGLTDKILTRIQTRETVSKVQSAFMIDLNQAAIAMRNSTPRSLVVLDEFGKGTATTGTQASFSKVLITDGERQRFQMESVCSALSWITS